LEALKHRYPNYLDDLKKKRNDLEAKGIKVKHNKWERYLNNDRMTAEQKISSILDDIDRMEVEAKRKESKIQNPGTASPNHNE